jgi:hypothetical protein
MRTNKILRTAALLGAVVVLSAAALSAGGVDAARGGKKGGGQTPPPTTATCSVNPNPAAWGGSITINGSGFAPYNSYGYDVNGWAGFVTADATGSFSTLSVAPLLGTDTVRFSNGTTCTFQVF